MERHLSACLPEEGCGLVGGLGAVARQLAVVENSLHSPVRFRMDALGQLTALQQFESRGLDLLAIFHSHPTGPDHPSATDLAEFYYPGVWVLIASPLARYPLQPGRLRAGIWQIGGFQILPQGFLEVELGVPVDAGI